MPAILAFDKHSKVLLDLGLSDDSGKLLPEYQNVVLSSSEVSSKRSRKKN